MVPSREEDKSSSIDYGQHAHNARCRAQTLREVAAELRDQRAAEILRQQASAWERLAQDMESRAKAESPPPSR